MKTFIQFLLLCMLVVSQIAYTQWSNDPTVNSAICTSSNDQVNPLIISDDSGGAIITWTDRRGGTYDDIYTQRINSAGEVQWTANGVAICTAADNQGHPMITSDGSGGAIITWEDYRSSANYDIYVQRINSAGVVQWTADGVAISTALAWQYGPMILPDGSGGAIITWEDYRNGSNYDIYAQRIDSAGVVQWTANGITVSTAADEQVYPMIASDGSNGAIITWEDKRSTTNKDIYATKLFSDGSLPVQLETFTANINSFNNHVLLEWMTSTETNCYGFEIQRRRNISNKSWLTVGFVAGNGNTNSPKLYSFTDKISSSESYIYRLKQIDRDGKFVYSKEIEVVAPKEFSLSQNYPNPFNPTTTIEYKIPKSSFSTLKIFDVLGREVATLVNDGKNAGSHVVQWDATSCGNGIYFYQLIAGEKTIVKKMVLMK